jgi:hypothetical protein
MAGLVHINTMREMLRSGAVCSIRHWKDDGSIVTANRVICTSNYYRGNTFNLKFLDSGVFRKVRAKKHKKLDARDPLLPRFVSQKSA